VTIVAAIEGAERIPKEFPFNVFVAKGEGGLEKDSVMLCNQIRTVDMSRFGKRYTSATLRCKGLIGR
jgi:mRNA-degrading endonuclease toxin of MazEF toxin-antitoxin module